MGDRLRAAHDLNEAAHDDGGGGDDAVEAEFPPRQAL